MDSRNKNKYYLYILNTGPRYHYHLQDEYRDITYLSRDSSINGSGFNHFFDYKIEINIGLFMILKKGNYIILNLDKFIREHGLEEYMI